MRSEENRRVETSEALQMRRASAQKWKSVRVPEEKLHKHKIKIKKKKTQTPYASDTEGVRLEFILAR